MTNFEEKKPDMSEGERRERNDLVQMCKDCFNLFKLAYNEQTTRMERQAGTYLNPSALNDQSAITADNSRVDVSSSRQQLKFNPKDTETQQALIEDNFAMKMKNGKESSQSNNLDLSYEFD